MVIKINAAIGGSNSNIKPIQQSCSNQRERLLEALRHRLISTLDAKRSLGMLHPAARIMELRRSGNVISQKMDWQVCDDGRRQRVAFYTLVKEADYVQLKLNLESHEE